MEEMLVGKEIRNCVLHFGACRLYDAIQSTGCNVTCYQLCNFLRQTNEMRLFNVVFLQSIKCMALCTSRGQCQRSASSRHKHFKAKPVHGARETRSVRNVFIDDAGWMCREQHEFMTHSMEFLPAIYYMSTQKCSPMVVGIASGQETLFVYMTTIAISYI